MLRKWEKLPAEMQNPDVKRYYDIIKKKKTSLFFKRIFDILISGILIVLLSPLFLIIAIAIKLDSNGPVFYRQERVTKYGKKFRIFKFRSMKMNDGKGLSITVNNDSRVTRVGHYIRKYKIDEISQLLDVFRGTMSFVGTRPEIPKYVACYSDEMMATLLLPAGMTSKASIYYRNESELLEDSDDVEKTYLEVVLPDKMKYNLEDLENFSLLNDAKTAVLTFLAVIGKITGMESIEEKIMTKK